MKPPPFTYHDPTTVDEAVALLAEKDNARLLAGGQSLMPMLNMRYVLPDDVKALAPHLLPHRLILTPDAQLAGRTTADAIGDVLTGVPAPDQ